MMNKSLLDLQSIRKKMKRKGANVNAKATIAITIKKQQKTKKMKIKNCISFIRLLATRQS